MFEKKYTLLRAQKKWVYEVLREVGLEPAEFSWSNEQIAGRLIISKLSHRDGEHYFQFSSYELNAWCIACPGVYRTMDYHYPKNWEEQEGIFRRWAQGLKRELDTADPWQELAKYRLDLDGEPAAQIVNEPIPAVEAEQIGRALAKLADDATRELGLNPEQSLPVRTRLDALAQAARRQRSRDWMYMVLGSGATIAMSLSLTPEQTATFWRVFRDELGPFAHLLAARGNRENRG